MSRPHHGRPGHGQPNQQAQANKQYERCKHDAEQALSSAGRRYDRLKAIYDEEITAWRTHDRNQQQRKSRISGLENDFDRRKREIERCKRTYKSNASTTKAHRDAYAECSRLCEAQKLTSGSLNKLNREYNESHERFSGYLSGRHDRRDQGRKDLLEAVHNVQKYVNEMSRVRNHTHSGESVDLIRRSLDSKLTGPYNKMTGGPMWQFRR